MESEGELVKTVRPVEAFRRLGRQVFKFGLDLLYPPTCLDCHAPIASSDALCARCFGKLRPITVPYCPRLGIPFQHDLGPARFRPKPLRTRRSSNAPVPQCSTTKSRALSSRG